MGERNTASSFSCAWTSDIAVSRTTLTVPRCCACNTLNLLQALELLPRFQSDGVRISKRRENESFLLAPQNMKPVALYVDTCCPPMISNISLIDELNRRGQVRSTLSSGPSADTKACYQIAPTSEQQQQTTTMEQRRCNATLPYLRSKIRGRVDDAWAVSVKIR